MAVSHVAQWESIGTNTVVDLFPGEFSTKSDLGALAKFPFASCSSE
jgi:hypothetical protein